MAEALIRPSVLIGRRLEALPVVPPPAVRLRAVTMTEAVVKAAIRAAPAAP